MNLISWASGAAQRVGHTLNNDLLKPVQRDVIAPVAHAAGNVVNAVEQAPQVVNRDVVQPTAHVASQVYDQANPFDNGLTFKQRTPTGGFSFERQLTHNGLTNVAGGAVKFIPQFAADYENTFANIGNRLGGGKNLPIQQNLSDPFSSRVVKMSGATGKNRQLAADAAQIALSAATPAAGKVIDHSLEAVAPKLIPKAVTRVVANAGTGAVTGAPFNAANYVANAPNPTLKGTIQAGVKGAQLGAALGGAGTVVHEIPGAVRLAKNLGITPPTKLNDAEVASARKVAKQAAGWGDQGLTTQDAKNLYSAQKKLGVTPGSPQAADAIQNAVIAHNAFDVKLAQRVQALQNAKAKLSVNNEIGAVGKDVKGAIPRSQLTGKALATPNSKLASAEQIGKALGMSDEELASLSESAPSTLKPLPPERAPLPATEGLYGSSKQASQLHGKTLSSDIPQAEDIINGHPSYPIEKKVSALDYLRTPERVLHKIGLGDEAVQLRNAEHAYKQELPKQIEQIKQWKQEVGNSPEASQRIFQYLDGQKVNLNPAEAKVAGEMKATLKSWADRLGIPEDRRITNYITHIFDESMLMKEFDPDLEKLIADKVPGSVYDPFTQQRLGAKGYKEDAFQAMQAYTKRAVRKVNFDPALEKLATAAEGLDKSGYDYVKRYGDRINMRPTEFDNLVDNAIKQSPVGYKLGNRPVAKISTAIRQATFRGSLGLNFGSAVRNLTQGVNTFAELGTHWTGVGYVKALQSIANGSKELQNVGVLDNSMVEDRVLSAGKQLLQKADKGLFAFFQTAEKVNRGAAYFGAKAKALKAGASLEDAVKAGVEAARKTQFTFGRIDTPVALQSDIVKLLTQFQSYNVKQAEFLGEMVKNKEFAKLLRFTGASAAVFFTVGKALGYRPTDMLPSAQIGGSPPFQAAKNAGSAIAKTFTAKTNSNSTRGQQIAKAYEKLGGTVGSATIPGFTQAKKTVGGIQAVNREQVKKGSTNYTIQPSTGNYVKGALFGPYSLNGPKSTPKVTIKSGTTNTTLTPLQSDAFNKQNNTTYNKLATQLHATPTYQQATAAKQATMDKTLKAEVTSSNKRVYAANNNIPLLKQATKAEQAVISGQLPAISAGSTSGIKIAPNLPKQYSNILTKYADTTTRNKAFATDNAAQYQYDLAKYYNNKANGSLSTAQDIQAQATLAKEQVGSNFSQNVRQLYGLSKTELYNYLNTPEKGVAKGEIANQLIAYDNALVNAGIITKGKFATGFAPSSGGSGGSSSKKTAQGIAAIAGAHIPAPKLANPTKLPAIKTAAAKKPALKTFTPQKFTVSKGGKITVRRGIV